MSEPTEGPPPGQRIRPPLRLVRPAEPPKARSKRHHRPPVFNAAQERQLRATLQNAARAFGTWACLADAMGMTKGALGDAMRRRRTSPEVAVRLAFATGISLDALLRPGVVIVGKCCACGRGDP